VVASLPVLVAIEMMRRMSAASAKKSNFGHLVEPIASCLVVPEDEAVGTGEHG